MMILRPLGLLAAVLFSPSGIPAADPVLTVHAKKAIVQLQPRDALRQQVTLPALDIAILASFDCPDANRALSLTLGISDTHQYFGPDLLASDASVEASFKVPASQLAPVSVPDFCVLGKPVNDSGMPLPGLATAQASLRCGGDSGTTSVHFDSVTVPAMLYCVAEEDSEFPSPDR